MSDLQNADLGKQSRVRSGDAPGGAERAPIRDLETIAREETDYFRLAELTEAEHRLRGWIEITDGLAKICQRRRQALESERCVYGHPLKDGKPYGTQGYYDENNQYLAVFSCSATCDHKMRWDIEQKSLKLLSSKEKQAELDRNAVAADRRRHPQA